jgi:aryl-alcohol dehydrogenase-like predicted oxidoreductase
VRLASTDLDVFRLCLGGNVFAWTLDEDGSFEVLDAYFAAGGNFIDTADSYGHWTSAGEGASERIIGRWIASRGNRDQLVIATKVGMSRRRPGLSQGAIRQAIEGSLERLGVETVDLYYAHRDDEQTPLEESLSTFGALIEEGKVRYVAASNYSAQRLQRALELAASEGLASFVALQPHYNLLERAYERDLAEVCARWSLACVSYYGLARGFLSGKYRPDGAMPDTPRAASVRESYFNERGFSALEALDEVADAHGSTPAAVALAWLAAQPTVLAPIASATSPAQVRQLVDSARLELSEQELLRLSAAAG